jgi:hypothetical protein
VQTLITTFRISAALSTPKVMLTKTFTGKPAMVFIHKKGVQKIGKIFFA